jgi:hypothetical protein
LLSADNHGALQRLVLVLVRDVRYVVQPNEIRAYIVFGSARSLGNEYYYAAATATR